MSLFPAYEDDKNEKHSKRESEWLENKSFAIDVSRVNNKIIANTSDDTTSDEDENDNKLCKEKKIQPHTSSSPIPHVQLDFTGKEEFYVDKNRARQYNSIKTLHKPARPIYRTYCSKHLGHTYYRTTKPKFKRYYRNSLAKDEEMGMYPLTENEYTELLGEYNRKTTENCQEIQNWLDLIALQDRNPYKWSRLRVAEKKIDYIEKALNIINLNKEETGLYEIYIMTITQCYTPHDVSKMLETKLATDPYSLILWQAQIMCTQGSMARCTVPCVLEIYERCMKKMFHSEKHSHTSSNQATDSVMMSLFYDCALFLRQSGLYEQLFALIKLGIELNVATNTQILQDLHPYAQNENTLLEYEELILQSGLPMNEIWLRIEKLRQGFFFLPFPGESSKCSDPQRIVFNEDVCHYVYPMKSTENSFKLLLIITRLLKLPFIQTHCLAVQFDGETDAIEDVLAPCTNSNYNMSHDHWDFFQSLYDLSKEMAVSPTFLNNSIGHEIYSECLQKFLINCAQAYELVDDRKRLVFLILWCRFQRLLLLVEQFSKKVNTEYIKQGRQRFKSLLKQRNNRNCLPIYVEYARYEHEAKSPLETVENIFKSLVEGQAEHLISELSYTYLSFAEVLLQSKDLEKVSCVLSAYALGCDFGSVTNARKLAALNTIKEKIELTIKIEENVDIMTLEQYFLPDHTVSQIKIYCLLLYCFQKKQQGLDFLQKLLLKFNSEQNARHQYLREQIHEFNVILIQLPGGNCYVPHSLVHQSIQKANQDYPRNLFLMQKFGCQTAVPWYKLRTGFLTKNTSIKSIIYLIALARCRFINSLLAAKNTEPSLQMMPLDLDYHEIIVRQRILHLFKVFVSPSTTLTSDKSTALEKNALFWRCYLRCLSDQSCSFERSKQCLLTALDECPWSKALYLDGATYVPQELSHLQDLLIEKQLRIYALPEELEILRER